MTRQPHPRPVSIRIRVCAPRPGPRQPARFRFTDWAAL